jgi:hypothetical protein
VPLGQRPGVLLKRGFPPQEFPLSTQAHTPNITYNPI